MIGLTFAKSNGKAYKGNRRAYGRGNVIPIDKSGLILGPTQNAKRSKVSSVKLSSKDNISLKRC